MSPQNLASPLPRRPAHPRVFFNIAAGVVRRGEIVRLHLRRPAPSRSRRFRQNPEVVAGSAVGSTPPGTLAAAVAEAGSTQVEAAAAAEAGSTPVAAAAAAAEAGSTPVAAVAAAEAGNTRVEAAAAQEVADGTLRPVNAPQEDATAREPPPPTAPVGEEQNSQADQPPSSEVRTGEWTGGCCST